MTLKPEYDAVIVGAGPVGANLANLMGKFGVSTLLIDKEDDVLEIPRAIGLCEEGSRVLGASGILERFEDQTLKIDTIRFQKRLGEQMFYAEFDEGRNGYPELRTFYQPDLERCMRSALEQYDHVELSTGTECLQFVDLGDRVKLRLSKLGETQNVSCRFLFACDGSTSPIRKSLGIPFEGETYGQDWLIFDATVDPNPDRVVMPLGDPNRPGITLPAPGGRRRWEFVVKEDDDRRRLFDDETIRDLLAPWGNVDDMAIERKTIYTFHSRIADTFQTDNVFLVGDAAHITPPFAGQGLMAGLRDTYNLAWKVSGVLNGQLRGDVLETYSTERIPQVQQINFFAKFIGSILLPQKRLSVFCRDVVINLTKALRLHSSTKPAHLRKMSNHINGTTFRNWSVSKFRKTGFELPQFEVGDATGQRNLIDRFTGDHFYLIAMGADPTEMLTPTVLARWNAIGGRALRIETEKADAAPYDCTRPSKADLLDKAGHYKSLFEHGRRVLVVRPDKMIVINTSPPRLSIKLAEYLDRTAAKSYELARPQPNLQSLNAEVSI